MAYTTIDDPKEYFSVNTWTADDTTPRSFTGFGHQPDLLWVKHRGSGSINPTIIDSVRGGALMLTSATSAAEDPKSHGEVTAFGSDGITVADGTSGSYPKLYFNDLDPFGASVGGEYVCWSWKESATAGFDIVAYTGDGSARTISHSLSAVPHFIIVKNRTDADSWRVYHHKNTAAPETDYLELDSQSDTVDSDTDWNDTAPTSSVFSVGTSDQTNENTDSLIAYLFSEKQGFSKFGSYTGNASTDGTFVYTGFRPAWILGKRTSASENWYIFDATRDPINPISHLLYGDTGTAEYTGISAWLDICSNGFKHRSTDSKSNSDDGSYVYVAFAEAPFVNSNGVPCNAR